VISYRFEQAYELEWTQPSALSNNFELKAGDSVAATLVFQKVFGSLAVGHTAADAWTFKRRGFLRATIGARVEGQESDIAVYEPNWSGTKGAITLSGGASYQWHSASFWGSEWQLVNPAGAAVYTLKTRGVFHHGAVVKVEPAGREDPNLAWLLLLGWHIVILHMQDSSHAAT
jgi:hypothetical protein